MYATLGHALPSGVGWTYEPKYDGMRVVAEASSRQVRLMTRNGKDKGAQFPEVVGVLRSLATRAGYSVVLDGEIVARRRRTRRRAASASEFQPLQARMHLKAADEIARLAVEAPATLVAFDLLREGRTSLAQRPWHERRARLEELFAAAHRSCSVTRARAGRRCSPGRVAPVGKGSSPNARTPSTMPDLDPRTG
jgi:bifunctional non-homologous end joining protein LigD